MGKQNGRGCRLYQEMISGQGNIVHFLDVGNVGSSDAKEGKKPKQCGEVVVLTEKDELEERKVERRGLSPLLYFAL